MLRGVLHITNPEVKMLLELLTDKETTLGRKLLAASERVDTDEQVFLSQDETEQLLDMLPPPNTDEANELADLRHRLQEYLRDLQQPAT